MINLSAVDEAADLVTRDYIKVLTAWKTADTFSPAGAGGRTDDPDLILAVEANATYILDAVLMFSSANRLSAANYKFNVPSGTTYLWGGIYGANDTPSATGGVNFIDIAAVDQSGSIIVGNNSDGSRWFTSDFQGMVWTSSTAGNFQLRWGQNGASNTIGLGTGSNIRLQRVA